jgi:hypothetical protein
MAAEDFWGFSFALPMKQGLLLRCAIEVGLFYLQRFDLENGCREGG